MINDFIDHYLVREPKAVRRARSERVGNEPRSRSVWRTRTRPFLHYCRVVNRAASGGEEIQFIAGRRTESQRVVRDGKERSTVERQSIHKDVFVVRISAVVVKNQATECERVRPVIH